MLSMDWDAFDGIRKKNSRRRARKVSGQLGWKTFDELIAEESNTLSTSEMNILA